MRDQRLHTMPTRALFEIQTFVPISWCTNPLLTCVNLF